MNWQHLRISLACCWISYLWRCVMASRRSLSSSSVSRSSFSASSCWLARCALCADGERCLRKERRVHRRFTGDGAGEPKPSITRFSEERLESMWRTSTGLSIRGEPQGEHCKLYIIQSMDKLQAEGQRLERSLSSESDYSGVSGQTNGTDCPKKAYYKFCTSQPEH